MSAMSRLSEIFAAVLEKRNEKASAKLLKSDIDTFTQQTLRGAQQADRWISSCNSIYVLMMIGSQSLSSSLINSEQSSKMKKLIGNYEQFIKESQETLDKAAAVNPKVN